MVVSERVFPEKPSICWFFLKNSATECSRNSEKIFSVDVGAI
jgi:hypothetical protein